MKKNIRFLIITLLITFSIGAKAQLNYKNGYIITLSNDTLYGLINDFGDIRNSKICVYKEAKKSRKVKYHPNEIIAYRFIGDKFYVSKELFFKSDFRYVFTDVLLEGQMNLYYDRKNQDMSYYIQRKGGDLIGLLNKNITVQGQGQNGHNYYGNYVNGFTINVYKDSLYSIFSDSKKIQKELVNVDYTQKDLINITKEYLNETCKGSDCIKYEKDLGYYKESFGVFTGIQFSNIIYRESKVREAGFPAYFSNYNDKSDIYISAPVGFFYNIPLQFMIDKLSFRIEFLTNAINYKKGSMNFSDPDTLAIDSRMFAIPILLKYEFLKSRISPTVAIGKSTSIVVKSQESQLHKTQQGGWFCEAGLNYKISPKISLFTNLRFQSDYTLILEDSNDNRLTYNNAVENGTFNHRFKTNYAVLFVGMEF